MSICYKTRFHPRVFSHIYIKHHTARYFMVSKWSLWDLSLPCFNFWVELLHLFAIGTPPECVAITPIRLIYLCNIFGYLHSKFFSAHPVLKFELPNDSIAFYQHMLNTSWKWWLSNNASLHCIIKKFDRVGVLYILWIDPGQYTVLPMYKNLSTLGHLPLAFVMILCCDQSIFFWLLIRHLCFQWYPKIRSAYSPHYQLENTCLLQSNL